MSTTLHQDINGNDNTTFGNLHAQGDINIYQAEATEEIELNLENYSSGLYTPPVCTQPHLQSVLRDHLAIFHGGKDLHLPSYIKHLATLIHHRQPAFRTKTLRRGPGGGKSIQETLRELKNPTILLVEDLVPLDILMNPDEVQSIAKAQGHFLLCTTKTAQDSWGVPVLTLNPIWHAIPLQDLYEPQVLISLLRARLDSENILIDQLWQPRDRDIAIDQAAISLQTPARIGSLMLMLAAENRTITAERFQELLKAATSGNRQFILTWYHKADEKQRLLLMAATLFQGLDEVQFFRLLDALIHDRWQHRVAIFKALDYCDLEELQDLCRFEEQQGDSRVLNPQVEDLEMDILETTWRGYRRHIQAALPIIRREIEESIGQGNRRQPLRLRRQLALSLSRLSLLSPEDFLPTLHQFASEKSIPLRKVAAQAIGAWRYMGHLQRMLATVDQWLEPDQNRIYVRYTALMALAFAADLDVPNQLHPEIIQRIKLSMKDRSPTIQAVIRDLIPNLLRSHPIQIAPIMLDEVLGTREHIAKRGLVEPIGKGLGAAANDYPKVMVAFLLQQIETTRQGSTSTGLGRHHNHRDRKLIALLEALSFIDYSLPAVAALLTPAELLRKLATLRTQESQPLVREAFMKAILHLMFTSGTLDRTVWEQLLANSIYEERLELIRALGTLVESRQITVVDPYFQLIVTDVSNAKYYDRLGMLSVLLELWPKHYQTNPDECMAHIAVFLQLFRGAERLLIVRCLGEIYLDCRARLQGGDFVITLHDRQIPMFRTNRPATTLEIQLLQWLDSPIRQCRKASLLTWMEIGRILEVEERTILAQWQPPVPEPVLDDGFALDEQEDPEASTSGRSPIPSSQFAPQAFTRIPLRARIIGCLCVLFVSREERQMFWQAVHVVVGRPRDFSGDIVNHALKRLTASGRPVPHALAARLNNLRQWSITFGAKV